MNWNIYIKNLEGPLSLPAFCLIEEAEREELEEALGKFWLFGQLWDLITGQKGQKTRETISFKALSSVATQSMGESNFQLVQLTITSHASACNKTIKIYLSGLLLLATPTVRGGFQRLHLSPSGWAPLRSGGDTWKCSLMCRHEILIDLHGRSQIRSTWAATETVWQTRHMSWAELHPQVTPRGADYRGCHSRTHLISPSISYILRW